MITLEDGLIKTCLLPVFSALLMAFKASANTEVLVIVDGKLNFSNFSVVRIVGIEVVALLEGAKAVTVRFIHDIAW